MLLYSIALRTFLLLFLDTWITFVQLTSFYIFWFHLFQEIIVRFYRICLLQCIPGWYELIRCGFIQLGCRGSALCWWPRGTCVFTFGRFLGCGFIISFSVWCLCFGLLTALCCFWLHRFSFLSCLLLGFCGRLGCWNSKGHIRNSS